VYKIPRLKEGKIPSVFPNLPKYLSKHLISRKPPLKRSSSPIKKKIISTKICPNVCVNEEQFNNTALDQNVIEPFSFLNIQNNFNIITLPKAWSQHNIPEKLIMFSYYIITSEENEMPTPILSKRVCLNTSLEAKCYVLNKEIGMDKFGVQKITCIETIAELLKNVDITNICSGYKIDNFLKTKSSYIDLTGSLRHQMC